MAMAYGSGMTNSNAVSGTVLLTIGRLPVALELARAFRACGWRVIVAEPYAWPMARLSRDVARAVRVESPSVDQDAYLEQLRDVIQTENVSLVVPVSEEILYVSLLEQSLPNDTKLLCASHACLLELHDKWRFNQLLRKLELPAPESRLASDIASIDNEMPDILKRRYVVKPRLSCGGQGVIFQQANTSPESDKCCDEFIVQQCLEGELCCTFAVVAEGNCVQLIAYRSLLDAGSVSVCFERTAVAPEMIEVAHRVAAHTAFCGMLSFDFMRNSDGQWLAIECNPRATSGLHLLAPYAVVQALLQAALPGEKKLPENETETQATVSPRRQEFWSSLGVVEGRLLRGNLDKAAWKILFNTRDVTWSLRDPLPFVLLVIVMWPVITRAFWQRKGLSEVLMQDVQWQTGIIDEDDDR